ncbi:hypothetical protein GQ42DRAFT_163386 [Ramicandelaber brevisporus]|nr:hypothetical protein GQ42DRAFT_163386 [Ramicandelaber brevisporus]
MPELPEVERARKLLERRALNKRITAVQAAEDSIVFTGTTTSPSDITKLLINRRLVSTGRKGKYFYAVLSSDTGGDGDGDGDGNDADDADKTVTLLMHFGMTGNIQFFGEDVFKYQQGMVSSTGEWPPKYWKLIISFDGTGNGNDGDGDGNGDNDVAVMAFTDPRRLGRILIIPGGDPTNVKPLSALGFDPILSKPTLAVFSALIKARAMPIKALLLDQSFSAGIGNWLADEILYQAGVHPKQRTDTLLANEICAIHTKMIEICQAAVDVDADSSKFPKEWLFHVRWDKGKVKNPKTHDGERIVFETVGSRTSAIVPARQKLHHATGVTATSTSTSIPTTNNKSRSKRKEVTRNDVMSPNYILPPFDGDNDANDTGPRRSKRLKASI